MNFLQDKNFLPKVRFNFNYSQVIKEVRGVWAIHLKTKICFIKNRPNGNGNEILRQPVAHPQFLALMCAIVNREL